MQLRWSLPIVLASVALAGFSAPRQTGNAAGEKAASAAENSDAPAYTADGQLRFPEHYREWIYLTSGLDMTYNPKTDGSGMSMFGNVFVNPSSYRAFLKTGTWPNGTTFVLENRGAVHGGEKQASLNKHGLSQTEELMGHELHVKDSSLPGGWGFFAFDEAKTAKIIARPASCYTCHEAHAAVDTTFVQFYPTLLGTARDKGTLSKTYLEEMAK
jgi:hypothetical protein